MRLLRSIRGHCSSQLDKLQVGVARGIGLLHCLITRECCSNAEFLLGPIDVNNPVAFSKLDQPTQPNRRAKDELVANRLIPSDFPTKST